MKLGIKSETSVCTPQHDQTVIMEALGYMGKAEARVTELCDLNLTGKVRVGASAQAVICFSWTSRQQQKRRETIRTFPAVLVFNVITLWFGWKLHLTNRKNESKGKTFINIYLFIIFIYLVLFRLIYLYYLSLYILFIVFMFFVYFFFFIFN